MARSAVLIVPWLVLAGVARAQEPAKGAPPSEAPLVSIEEAAAPTKRVRLPSGVVVTVPADSTVEGEEVGPARVGISTPARPETSRSARLLLESLGGFLGGAGGLLGGYMFTLFLHESTPYLTIGAGLVGVATGVLTTGYYLGSDGSAVTSVLFEVLGVLAGLGLMSLGSINPLATYPVLLAVAAAPLVGAVVGLELVPNFFPMGLSTTKAMVLPVNGGAMLALGGRM